MEFLETLASCGLPAPNVVRNASPAELYEHAVRHDACLIASSGALVARSGAKTGRSPKDKRIVRMPVETDDVWWGHVNIPLSEASFTTCRKQALEYLRQQNPLYVVDGFAGWDPAHQLKVRVVCSRPYHALFMHNMLIRPTPVELETFGQPDFTIFNAGPAAANPLVEGVTSNTCVAFHFSKREAVLLGTEYAGEMKKGVFTLMNFLMPRKHVLSMHCAANAGPNGDVTLFFGLSGTGKTTLSADPRRQLIGDDEHCWTDTGVFNIEGGCYAKCLGLSQEKEPQIFDAIRFGAILENTPLDARTRRVDFNSSAITENTRASYPIEYMPRVKLPCLADHPRNILLLTCDAFGVLPPVARLTRAQAMYHFVSGYTAKVAGTEMGVTEPEATFSACFGAAFLVLHPIRYAELLAEKLDEHFAQVWLINTGWSGGPHGVGRRMSLAHTRAIIDAIHSGELVHMPTDVEPAFGFAVPRNCTGVPTEILMPRKAWANATAYDATAERLARLFHKNFAQYADAASESTCAAGPRVGRL